MKNFEEWSIFKEESSSNKNKAIIDLVDAIKGVFKKYDITTRKKIWNEITSLEGKELVDKIVKNPKTYLSDSEFIKLVQKGKK
jgi:hypothetical protein